MTQEGKRHLPHDDIFHLTKSHSIHMEWCFDECNLALYHPDKEAVSTTANPHCSAAVLFSKRGKTSRKVVVYPKFTERLKFDFL
jgi:hypothetical protein